MFRRINYRNVVHQGPAPEASLALERDGMAVVPGALAAGELAALRAEVEDVFRWVPPDGRHGSSTPEHAQMFRYEMFNRSARCQAIVCDRRILDILEPLLGEDCHAITCTAWRNPADPAHAPNGQEWHTDGGPHVPRPPGVAWPEAIPYPIFTVATHVFLQDQDLEDGPTSALLGSHRSGLVPPQAREWDLDLEYEGRRGVPMLARAGDLGFFVSDVWHRRLPPLAGGRGRFFLQINYGRRDIAQRVRPTTRVNHVSEEARARAATDRDRMVLGLHPQRFYDG